MAVLKLHASGERMGNDATETKRGQIMQINRQFKGVAFFL